MLPPVLVFLIIFSLLVLVHELGHFLIAKKAGIKVEEFGFGYPPRLISIRYGETVYSINLLPLGGFVKLYGEEGEIKKEKDLKRAFFSQSKKKRVIVLLSGVLANFLLGIACFSFIYSTVGIPTKTTKVIIAGIAPDSPAEEAGLKPNDEILSIIQIMPGEPVKQTPDSEGLYIVKSGDNLWLIAERIFGNGYKWVEIAEVNGLVNPGFIMTNQKLKIPQGQMKKDEDLATKPIIRREKISSIEQFQQLIKQGEGKEVLLKVKRENEIQELEFKLLPRINPPEGEGAIGVALTNIEMVFHQAWQMPFRAVLTGVEEALAWGSMVVIGLLVMIKNLIAGQLPQDVAGPVGIYQLTTGVASQGWLMTLQFIGVLSVNLAILNVAPFPALDGGRILFVILEKVIGKRVKPKVEQITHLVGMALLLSLMVLVTINDLARFQPVADFFKKITSFFPVF